MAIGRGRYWACMDLNRLARGLILLPALLVVGLVRLMRPLYLVRFGVLVSGRIGHLAANTEIYLCERAAGLHPRGRFGGVDLWCHYGPPCNAQLARMIERVLHVDRTGFVRMLVVANRSFSGWERHEAGSEQHDRDIHNLMERQPRHILDFTGFEKNKGAIVRRKMGIPDGKEWVCLIVRDGAYLNHPGFAYHNYRDTKIWTYRRAAVALAERGYYVIRMGAAVEEPLHCDHPRVIDYATNGMRSDFMDVYLAAHCAFMVSSGTGLDAIAVIARRPVCFVNYVPLEYLNTWVRGIAIWKRHYRGAGKNIREMEPAEICNCGAGQFLRAEDFKRAKIRLKDNTPEEIEAAVLEMADDLRNELYEMTYPLGCAIDSYALQLDFWRRFPSGTVSNYNGKPLHGEVRLRIGREFLKAQEHGRERALV